MKFRRVSLLFAVLVAVCLPVVGQTAMQVNISLQFRRRRQVTTRRALQGCACIEPGPHRMVRIFSDHVAVMLVTKQADSTQKSSERGRFNCTLSSWPAKRQQK
jgi:hypothetical protein